MSFIVKLLLGLLIGVIFTVLYEFIFRFVHKKTKKEPILRIKGYHFHHSIYGLILIIGYLLAKNLILLGAGLGIIIRHTYDEKKIAFVEKEYKKKN